MTWRVDQGQVLFCGFAGVLACTSPQLANLTLLGGRIQGQTPKTALVSRAGKLPGSDCSTRLSAAVWRMYVCLLVADPCLCPHTGATQCKLQGVAVMTQGFNVYMLHCAACIYVQANHSQSKIAILQCPAHLFTKTQ